MNCDCSSRQDLVQVTVEALSNGPFAVARYQGQVLFLAGVAPGDTAAVKITRRRPNYLWGHLVHLCHPGASHRHPPCPFYAGCGGCPWQQVKEPVQRAAKISNVRETFARLGGIELRDHPRFVPSPFDWAYRSRVRLHLDERRELGFKRLRGNQVTPVSYCMVAEPVINAELGTARELARRLESPIVDVEIVAVGDGRVVLVARGSTDGIAAGDRAATRTLLERHRGVAGVVIDVGGECARFGETWITGGRGADRQPAQVFSQVNREANLLLVEAVVEAAALTGREQVVELHCGAGNFSMALAPRARLLAAFDKDPEAVAAARRNAAQAGVFNACFESADAASALARQAPQRIDVAVLDPPRSGAREVVAAVAKAAIPRVVYVGCDLATAARDAGILVCQGYEIKSAVAVDLFPQTHHVEIVLAAIRARP